MNVVDIITPGHGICTVSSNQPKTNFMNSLLTILIFIVIVGVVLWLISIAPFLDEQWKGISRWLIIVIAVIWLLFSLFGHGRLGDIHL
jgi:hypothetical protein